MISTLQPLSLWNFLDNIPNDLSDNIDDYETIINPILDSILEPSTKLLVNFGLELRSQSVAVESIWQMSLASQGSKKCNSSTSILINRYLDRNSQ